MCQGFLVQQPLTHPQARHITDHSAQGPHHDHLNHFDIHHTGSIHALAPMPIFRVSAAGPAKPQAPSRDIDPIEPSDLDISTLPPSAIRYGAQLHRHTLNCVAMRVLPGGRWDRALNVRSGVVVCRVQFRDCRSTDSVGER